MNQKPQDLNEMIQQKKMQDAMREQAIRMELLKQAMQGEVFYKQLIFCVQFGSPTDIGQAAQGVLSHINKVIEIIKPKKEDEGS